jgi:uncharacterized membrane protein YfcA
MHIVIGTSLACTAINALSATYFHHKHKKVDWVVIYRILPGIVLGSLLGSLIAENIPGHFLQVLFGVFACSFALRLIKSGVYLEEKAHVYPKTTTFIILGSFVSCLSNLLGIGGGIFMVPLLSFYRFTPRMVLGTSSCFSFFISFFGALLFLYKAPYNFPSSYGYIYLPAFVLISIFGSLSAFYGVKLAQTLPVSFIQRIFAISLLAVGIFMIFK